MGEDFVGGKRMGVEQHVAGWKRRIGSVGIFGRVRERREEKTAVRR